MKLPHYLFTEGVVTEQRAMKQRQERYNKTSFSVAAFAAEKVLNS